MEFYLDNKIPLCKCGCENKVNWHKILYKFNDYISGHNPEANKFSSTNQPNISKEEKFKLSKELIEVRKKENLDLK